MAPTIAVLLDEFVPQGGELQIKRRSPWKWRTAAWELVLWVPGEGTALKPKLRLSAPTAHELIEQLEASLAERDGTPIAAA